VVNIFLSAEFSLFLKNSFIQNYLLEKKMGFLIFSNVVENVSEGALKAYLQ